MKFAVDDWPVISALLDEALDLPAERRGRWLDELPDGPLNCPGPCAATWARLC